MDFNELERGRGCLIHTMGTYPQLIPYLKVIHQTIDSWSPGRDVDGWKMTVDQTENVKEFESISLNSYKDVSTRVKVVSRLAADI